MKQNYIGENIRIYRERAKFTQQQLADKVGVSWEMISRYERNQNSPFKKLHLLANALSISQSLLMERHVPTTYNSIPSRIPLFMHIPVSGKFYLHLTNYFYNCPEWMVKRDEKCFAIESSLVQSESQQFLLDGVLFISSNVPLNKGDYVLIKQDEGLHVLQYENQNTINVVGKVIAKETRY
ncbi:hypothetical protein A2436_02985 [candidate division WS6 bacterium RIFOXYC1_FULL_33_9]|nr:MAG: hypothetical protein A2369_02330 [candidate division WS6 bacterium RIFOXYB1_FULL_33_15]OGC38014.1 MAG: hypothetical protein A2436_02985 [candidate division WS6 bacterium RIFOXYC1_FULL_33_9]